MNEPDTSVEESPQAGASPARRGERIREAAIEVELATGTKEPTSQHAWRSSMVRFARMGVGLFVVLLGIILMPLPGPGLLVVAVGLAILARDVAWADRLLRKVRERIPKDAQGRIPRATIITMAVLAAAGIALSIWMSVSNTSVTDLVFFWRD